MDGEGSHKSGIWSLGIVAIEISEGRLSPLKMRVRSIHSVVVLAVRICNAMLYVCWCTVVLKDSSR